MALAATSRSSRPRDVSETSVGTENCPENSTSCEDPPASWLISARIPTARRAGDEQAQHPEPRQSPLFEHCGGPPDRDDDQGDHDADGNGQDQVEDPGALIHREVRNREAHGVEATPAAKPDEQDIAERRRDQPREQSRDERCACSHTRLEEQDTGHQRTTEQRGDGREDPGSGHHLGPDRVQAQ